MSRRPTLPIPTEAADQTALFDWASIVADALLATRPGATWTALDMLFAVPNGGLRARATAGRLKAEGVKAGVPDVCLPARSGDGHYSCLWIELKRLKGGRVSPEQAEWIERLSAQPGHRAVVCRGWVEAAREISAYLGLPPEYIPEGA